MMFAQKPAPIDYTPPSPLISVIHRKLKISLHLETRHSVVQYTTYSIAGMSGEISARKAICEMYHNALSRGIFAKRLSGHYRPPQLSLAACTLHTHTHTCRTEFPCLHAPRLLTCGWGLYTAGTIISRQCI